MRVLDVGVMLLGLLQMVVGRLELPRMVVGRLGLLQKVVGRLVLPRMVVGRLVLLQRQPLAESLQAAEEGGGILRRLEACTEQEAHDSGLLCRATQRPGVPLEEDRHERRLARRGGRSSSLRDRDRERRLRRVGAEQARATLHSFRCYLNPDAFKSKFACVA